MISEVIARIRYINREINRTFKKADGRVFVPLNDLRQTYEDLGDLDDEIESANAWWDYIDKAIHDTNVRRNIVLEEIKNKVFKSRTIVLKDLTKNIRRAYKTDMRRIERLSGGKNLVSSFSDKTYLAYFYTASGRE